MKLIDLVGKRFGRLVVVSRAENNRHGGTVWNCKCDCGGAKSIAGKSLRVGETQSCGCLQRENGMKHRIDLKGLRFGRLIVERYAGHGNCKENKWECLCDCGKKTIVSTACLRRGNTQSCGCFARERFRRKYARVDLTGQVFGLLRVLREADPHKPYRYWWCLCECGKEVEIKQANLRAGRTTDCGCKRVYRYYPRVPREEENLGSESMGFSNYWSTFSNLAHRRGLELSLSRKAVYDFTQMPCHYCGAVPSNRVRYKKNKWFVYNGLDRIDNSIGYEIGNVVPCCWKCNVAKGAGTVDEFREWVKRISAHWLGSQIRSG